MDGGLTASTPPKLSLLSSFPSKTKYSETPPGMVTPPLRTSTISIPFQWEEAPGKPRNSNSGGGGGAARCLELPPRLLPEGNKVISSSPTTVLDGPYIGRSVSLRRGGSFRGLEGLVGGEIMLPPTAVSSFYHRMLMMVVVAAVVVRR